MALTVIGSLDPQQVARMAFWRGLRGMAGFMVLSG